MIVSSVENIEPKYGCDCYVSQTGRICLHQETVAEDSTIILHIDEVEQVIELLRVRHQEALDYCPEWADEFDFENADRNTETESKEPLTKALLYTDGSCLVNPGGPGGVGVVVETESGTEEMSKAFDEHTTNNRMEIMAIIEGLKFLKSPSEVTVHSDSLYAINCASGKWKRKKNKDLWRMLSPLLEVHKVTFQWVRGHSGHVHNERCDELAYNAALSVKNA